jgi:glycosyltransferase involved in cell wall biosynthesis
MSLRPIRVAFLIDKLHRAGAQVHLGQLVSRLDRGAFTPEVVCLLGGGPVADELRENGVRVEVLSLGRLYSPRGMLGLPRLARRLRASKPDVLHTYLTSANIYGALAGRLAGVGAVVTSRRDTGFSRNWRLRLVEECLINPFVDRVTAVCPAVATATRGERGLRNGQIVTIPNGVDLTRFDPERHSRAEARHRWGLRPEQEAVGAIGNLLPAKGHADLLKAAALVVAQRPDTHFFLVGDGPLRPDLEALADQLGIRGRVVFTGPLQDVSSVLAMLDVVVLPSHHEGLSNVLLESMAMARPVVATAAGGNPDVVRDGVNGRLVPTRDPQALAAAILALLEDSPAAASLGREARRLVGREFSLERMVAGYEVFYRDLVESRRAGSAPSS